jgi:hypothetical protein
MTEWQFRNLFDRKLFSFFNFIHFFQRFHQIIDFLIAQQMVGATRQAVSTSTSPRRALVNEFFDTVGEHVLDHGPH